MRSGKRVEDDETNPLVSVLRLSGIARIRRWPAAGQEPIYERVFDRDWMAQNMPDAEVRRQRAAYRRGSAATAMRRDPAVIAALSVAAVRGRQQAVRQQHIAEQEREKAEQQRGRAEEEAQRADSNAQNLGTALAEAEQQRQEALSQQQFAEQQKNLPKTSGTGPRARRCHRHLLYSAHMNLAARDWQDSSIEHMRDLLALQ